MKRETIPTAPLERAKWHEYLSKQPRRSGWLILTLALSVGAGFVGALAAQVYQWEDFIASTPDIVIVPDGTGSEQAKFVERLTEQQGQSVVTITGGTVDGVGVVVSSDGWIVTTAAVAPKGSTNLAIETTTGKQYVADDVIVDSYSQLAYVHVPSTGLRPAEFREPSVGLGEAVVAFTPNQVAFTNIGEHRLELSTPRRTSQLALAYASDRPLTVAAGTPVYDFNQSIVGIAFDETTIIPITAVNEVVFGLFSEQVITRPTVDITYTQAIAGATVVSSNMEQLEVGDVITSMNTVELTSANDLSDLIAQADIGDTVTFTVTRDSESVTVQFVLN